MPETFEALVTFIVEPYNGPARRCMRGSDEPACAVVTMKWRRDGDLSLAVCADCALELKILFGVIAETATAGPH